MELRKGQSIEIRKWVIRLEKIKYLKGEKENE